MQVVPWIGLGLGLGLGLGRNPSISICYNYIHVYILTVYMQTLSMYFTPFHNAGMLNLPPSASPLAVRQHVEKCPDHTIGEVAEEVVHGPGLTEGRRGENTQSISGSSKQVHCHIEDAHRQSVQFSDESVGVKQDRACLCSGHVRTGE